MVRAVIVDDEDLGRRTLAGLLAEYCPDVHVVDTAASSAEARIAVLRHAPDVVFLDIAMPGENGFVFLDSIHPDHRTFAVIFVTAYDQYALRAIKASAMDYLLKPVDIDELRAAVAKVDAVRSGPTSAREPYATHMQAVLDNVRTPGFGITRVALPTGQGLRLVGAGDIIRCEGDDNYSTFFLTGGDRVVVCKTIREFEDILADGDFVRIHKSHLINLRHARQYLRETQRDSGGYVIMSNGHKVEVARRRKEELLRRFNGG